MQYVESDFLVILFVDKWVDIDYNKNVPERDIKKLWSHGLKTEVNYGLQIIKHKKRKHRTQEP